MARVNATIPDDLLEKIDERAKALCVNRSAYMSMAIARQIESETVVTNLPAVLEVLNRALDSDDKKGRKK